jgi:hypothetical protein
VLEADNHQPSTSPKEKALYTRSGSSTIYGCKFLAGALDEAHLYRNVKEAYWSAFALSEQTAVTVAMTATPATTRPMVFKLPFLYL